MRTYSLLFEAQRQSLRNFGDSLLDGFSSSLVTIANPVAVLQDQEAKDPPIPLPKRHRPQVPKKSQARPAWHDEGAEGGQGGKERCGMIGKCVGGSEDGRTWRTKLIPVIKIFQL
jgi:hypothetical protein